MFPKFVPEECLLCGFKNFRKCDCNSLNPRAGAIRTSEKVHTKSQHHGQQSSEGKKKKKLSELKRLYIDLQKKRERNNALLDEYFELEKSVCDFLQKLKNCYQNLEVHAPLKDCLDALETFCTDWEARDQVLSSKVRLMNINVRKYNDLIQRAKLYGVKKSATSEDRAAHTVFVPCDEGLGIYPIVKAVKKKLGDYEAYVCTVSSIRAFQQPEASAWFLTFDNVHTAQRLLRELALRCDGSTRWIKLKQAHSQTIYNIEWMFGSGRALTQMPSNATNLASSVSFFMNRPH